MKYYSLKRIIISSAMIAFLFSPAIMNSQKTSSDNFYGRNLLKNPGAEADNDDNGIPDWKPIPVVEKYFFMNEYYGHTGGEWEFDCDEKCGLPPGAGTRYFRLPAADEIKMFALWQEVDLLPAKDSLIKRHINFTLSGYIAGFKCDTKDCGSGTLIITFYDSSGKEVGKFEKSKDSFDMQQANTEDQRMRQFEKINVSSEIPVNATKAKITIEADSKCCNGSYIFFDNLSFILDKADYRK